MRGRGLPLGDGGGPVGALILLALRRGVLALAWGARARLGIALPSGQREAILRDPDWQGGNYSVDRPPRSGMRVARKLGTITYRSAAEPRQRFGREPIARTT